jgi:ankyrin repeat protein
MLILQVKVFSEDAPDNDLNTLNEKGFTKLMSACSDPGGYDTAKKLIKQGADANKAGIDGKTPLFLAVSSQNHDTVKLLIKSKANVNAADSKGNTPLMEACSNIEIFRNLIDEGADVNAENLNGYTVFMKAAGSGISHMK